MRMSVSLAIIAVMSSCLSWTATAADWGDFKGKIVVKGSVPDPDPLQPNKDVAVCGKHELIDESLLVGEGGGLKNVVVFLAKMRGREQNPEVHPSYKDAAAKPVLDNSGCRFDPHIILTTVDEGLLVKNSDPVGHNAQIVSIKSANSHNPNIPPGQEQELDFAEAETVPLKVACGSHPWMSAYVLIRDEPYAAVTDENGEFEIKNLPDGDWTFVFWHEKGGKSGRGGYLYGLSGDGLDFGRRYGELEVTIKGGEVTDIGTLEIDASDLLK